VLSLLVYPDFFAMNTYMSENALMPAWSQYAYSTNRLYANMASQLTVDYYAFQTSLSASLSDDEWSRYVFARSILLFGVLQSTWGSIKAS
jgi:hypothetical protein